MLFLFPHHFNTIRTNTQTYKQQSSFNNIDAFKVRSRYYNRLECYKIDRLVNSNRLEGGYWIEVYKDSIQFRRR